MALSLRGSRGVGVGSDSPLWLFGRGVPSSPSRWSRGWSRKKGVRLPTRLLCALPSSLPPPAVSTCRARCVARLPRSSRGWGGPCPWRQASALPFPFVGLSAASVSVKAAPALVGGSLGPLAGRLVWLACASRGSPSSSGPPRPNVCAVLPAGRHRRVVAGVAPASLGPAAVPGAPRAPVEPIPLGEGSGRGSRERFLRLPSRACPGSGSGRSPSPPSSNVVFGVRFFAKAGRGTGVLPPESPAFP